MLKLKPLYIFVCIALGNSKALDPVEDYITETANSTTTLPLTSTNRYLLEWISEPRGSNDTSLALDDSPVRTRIIGGRPVDQLSPYQVSLQRFRRGRYEHMCGGCIITAHHVLTAAHCLLNLRANDISVVVGSGSWRQGGDRHRVLDMRRHQGFSLQPIIINDIAVLKVWPPFNLGKSSVAILALGGRARIGENVPVRLTGWGSMTPTAVVLPEQLQMLDYYTISNRDCAHSGHRITANELCALGKHSRGACMGDSGGPLITLYDTPKLVGILSYGSPTCAQGQPDVYTRVSSFLPYINRVITSEMA